MQKQNIKANRKIKIHIELKRLRKELAKAKLERDILEKNADYQIKFDFSDQYLSCFSVKDMCRILNVSTSGYYKWRSRALSIRAQHNLVLLEKKKNTSSKTKKYGSPRIAKELEASGFHASEKLIRN